MNLNSNMISVILPVKDGARFIEACIVSFMEQRMSEVSTELIIVDDSSADDTYSIAMSLANKDKRIHVYRNTGAGVIDALKTGYLLASGDYISRMDADDIMPADKLQNLYNILQNSDAQVATGKVKYFHYDKSEVGDGYMKYESWLNSIVDKQSYYSEIYKECVVASPNWLIRREDFDRSGAFDGMYPEDYDLVFRWYFHGYRILGSQQVTHHWYDHSLRASRTSDLYVENNFFALKLDWFFKIDYNDSGRLLIYGAGNKAKYIVRYLVKFFPDIEIIWCTNNSKKIGKEIYGITLISDQESIESYNAQMIIAIAVDNDKMKIGKRLKINGMLLTEDYFFFS